MKTVTELAAMAAGLGALIAAAALNVPAALGCLLALNALLGRLEVRPRAQVYRTAASDAGQRRNAERLSR